MANLLSVQQGLTRDLSVLCNPFVKISCWLAHFLSHSPTFRGQLVCFFLSLIFLFSRLSHPSSSPPFFYSRMVSDSPSTRHIRDTPVLCGYGCSKQGLWVLWEGWVPFVLTKGMFNISEPKSLIQAPGRVLVEVWFEGESLFTLAPVWVQHWELRTLNDCCCFFFFFFPVKNFFYCCQCFCWIYLSQHVYCLFCDEIALKSMALWCSCLKL